MFKSRYRYISKRRNFSRVKTRRYTFDRINSHSELDIYAVENNWYSIQIASRLSSRDNFLQLINNLNNFESYFYSLKRCRDSFVVEAHIYCIYKRRDRYLENF